MERGDSMHCVPGDNAGVAKRCWAAAGIRMRVLWYAVLCCAAAQQLGALGLRLFHRPLLPADFWLLFGVVFCVARADCDVKFCSARTQG